MVVVVEVVAVEVVVVSIVEDSLAARAGNVAVGSRVLQVDGEPVSSMRQVVA